MAIEKVAYDALDKLVNIKVAADYLGDSATEEETAMLEKEAAIAGTLTKMMGTVGSKAGNIWNSATKASSKALGKTVGGLAGVSNGGAAQHTMRHAMKAVGNTANKVWDGATKHIGNAASSFDATKMGKSVEKAWNSERMLKARDYMNQHGKDIRDNVIKGAAVGATKGAFSNYKDPEDHKVHRFKNIMHGAAQGAAVGGVGTAVYKGAKYTPSKEVPYNQIKMDLDAAGTMKTSSALLDELVLEKQANVSGITTIGGTALGAIKGATKAFAKSTGSMPQRLGQAALGGLKSGAKGAMAGATGGAIMDAMTNKTPNDQQTENRFQ